MAFSSDDRRGHPERHGRELARHGLLLERVEVLAGHGEERLCLRRTDPALDGRATGVAVLRLEVELLGHLPLHHRERVAGRLRLVDDEHTRGPRLLAHLVLVGPPAVVGHRLAAEHGRVEPAGRLRVLDGRIADEHHHRLAAKVDALVVVPLELGGLDAVADEHEIGRVERDALGDPFRPRDVVVVPGGLALLAALAEDEGRRALDRRPDERHRLYPRAVGVAGSEARSRGAAS